MVQIYEEFRWYFLFITIDTFVLYCVLKQFEDEGEIFDLKNINVGRNIFFIIVSQKIMHKKIPRKILHHRGIMK